MWKRRKIIREDGRWGSEVAGVPSFSSEKKKINGTDLKGAWRWIWAVNFFGCFEWSWTGDDDDDDDDNRGSGFKVRVSGREFYEHNGWDFEGGAMRRWVGQGLGTLYWKSGVLSPLGWGKCKLDIILLQCQVNQASLVSVDHNSILSIVYWSDYLRKKKSTGNVTQQQQHH